MAAVSVSWGRSLTRTDVVRAVTAWMLRGRPCARVGKSVLTAITSAASVALAMSNTVSSLDSIYTVSIARQSIRLMAILTTHSTSMAMVMNAISGRPGISMNYQITPELCQDLTPERKAEIEASIDEWKFKVHPWELVMTVISFYKRIHRDDIFLGMYEASRRFPVLFEGITFTCRCEPPFSEEVYQPLLMGAERTTWVTYAGRWDGYFDIGMRYERRIYYRDKFVDWYDSDTLRALMEEFEKHIEHEVVKCRYPEK